MSNLDFYVGARVVCINDKFVNLYFTYNENFPKLGETYTIRKIMEWFDGSITFLLEEVVNAERRHIPEVDVAQEPSWYSWHFRPVKKTDISIFEELLNPTDEALADYVVEQIKELEKIK